MPCYPSKEEELSENLFHNLPPQTVHNPSFRTRFILNFLMKYITSLRYLAKCGFSLFLFHKSIHLQQQQQLMRGQRCLRRTPSLTWAASWRPRPPATLCSCSTSPSCPNRGSRCCGRAPGSGLAWTEAPTGTIDTNSAARL